MHSLFVRIFMLFWMAMAVIVVGSIAVTYAIAARNYESIEWQRRPSVALTASAVLAQDGVAGLTRWLRQNQNSLPDREFFIMGPDGADILGRHLTESATRRWEFINHEVQGAGGAHSFDGPRELPPAPYVLLPGAPPGAPGGAPPVPPPTLGLDAAREAARDEARMPLNFRPSRLAPQLVAADGSTYTILLVPRRPSLFGALSLPGIPLALLGIVLIVSALASWWLAEHLSAPIRRLQEGARAVASEKLDVRVSAGLDGRRDELAVLARDFDAMADQLKATRTARTQLLRDISHELRSPLARMRVALGIARQRSADPIVQLDRLEREVERLDSLIGQVLRLARLHGTDTPFKREDLALEEILQEVIQDANFEAAAKQCTVRLGGAPAAALRGNRELLQSAIENVLRNAVRYSPAGKSVDVDVSRTREEVEIVIRDQGPGVPGADLTRIFEPFYRVAEARDRDSGGEGIGLAITAQVLAAHGGRAEAKNLPDGGLEVRLTLPLRQAQAAPVPAAAAGAAGAANPSAA
jgi:two-component system sensor histidine kinase CpxA